MKPHVKVDPTRQSPVSRIVPKALLLSLSLSPIVSIASTHFVVKNSLDDPPEVRPNEITLSVSGNDSLSFDEEAIHKIRYGLTDSTQLGLHSFSWQNEDGQDWKWISSGKFLRNPDEVAIQIRGFYSESFRIQLRWNRETNFNSPYGLWYSPTNLWPTPLTSTPQQINDRLRLNVEWTTPSEWTLSLGYEWLSRDGTKSSTRKALDGPETPHGRKGVGIAPTESETDENQHTVDIGLRKTFSNDQKVAIALRYRENSQRNTRRSEISPSSNHSRFLNHQTSNRFESWNTHAKTERRLNDNWLYSAAIAFYRYDGELDGSRIYGSQRDPIYDANFNLRKLNEAGFLDLYSDQQIERWSYHGNLLYTPNANWRIRLALETNDLSQSSFSNYLGTNQIIDWQIRQRINEESQNALVSDKNLKDLFTEIEIRYQGFKRSTVYLTGKYIYEDIRLQETWNKTRISPQSLPVDQLLDRLNDGIDKTKHFKTGWSVSLPANLRISLQAYYKERESSYDPVTTARTPSDYTDYPNFILSSQLSIKDANAQITWKPIRGLTLSTRFDIQNNERKSKTTVTQRAYPLDQERKIFNQTITWVPIPQLYLQASGLWVSDLSQTPAANITGVFADVVRNVPSDYRQAYLSAYWIVRNWAHLEVAGSVLDMDNYENNTPQSVAYGNSYTDFSSRVILHLFLKETTRISLGYGYYDFDEKSGHENLDTEIHQLFTRLQFNF